MTNPRKIVYTLPDTEPVCGHRLGINSLVCAPWSDSTFSPTKDKASLISSSRDGSIIGWSLPYPLNDDPPIPKGSPNLIIRGHLDWVNDLIIPSLNYAPTPSVISASNDRSIRLWRLRSSSSSSSELPISATGFEVGHHSDYVKCLAYAQDAQFLVTGGLDRRIGIWDFGHEVRGNLGWLSTADATPKQSVYALSTHSTGSVIISGSPDKLIRIYDPRTKLKVGQLVGHTDHVRSVKLLPDALTVLSASSDRTIKLWSLHTNRCIATYSFHSDSVWSLEPTVNGSCVTGFYSAGRDGCLFHTKFDHTHSTPIVHDPPPRTTALVFREDAKTPNLTRGINRIAAMNGFIFAATSSSTIYGWRDLAQQEWDQVSHTQLHLLSDNYELSAVFSTAKGLRSASHSGTVSSDWIDSLMSSVDPIRANPSMELPGYNGLIKHSMLSNKRHVLTMDTAGHVELWDIICCTRSRSFGVVDFDATYMEVNVLEYNTNWCSVNTRIGTLSVQLSEQRCFDTEMYMDEFAIEGGVDYEPDQRTNIGRWVLISLFRTYIEHIKVRREPTTPASSAYSDDASSDDPLSKSTTESSGEEKDSMPPSSPNESSQSALVGSPVSTPQRQFRARNQSIEVFEPIVRGRDMSRSVSEPTACNSPTSPKGSQSLVSRFRSMSLRRLGLYKAEPGNSQNKKPVAKSEPCSPLFSPFSGTEQPTTNSNTRAVPSEHEEETLPPATLEPTDTTPSPTRPPASDRGHTQQRSTGAYLPIPSDTVIAIMEEEVETCSPYAKWVGTVGTCGTTDVVVLEHAIPPWLSALIVRDAIPDKEPVKIGFLLAAHPNSGLPDLRSGNQRLLANRMVRVRRILAYIVSSAQINVPPSVPVEEYMELIVAGSPVNPLVTLASIKTYIWRPTDNKTADLIATYRLKSPPGSL